VKEQIAKELEGKTFDQQKKLLQQLLSGEVKLKNSDQYLLHVNEEEKGI